MSLPKPKFNRIIQLTAIVLVCSLIPAWFIFQPKNVVLLPTGFNAEKYEELPFGADKFIETERGKIHLYVMETHGARKALLYSHGSANNITRRIPQFKIMRAAGWSVYAYDYHGYGRSTGKPDVNKLTEDAVLVYDFLTQEKHFKPEQVIAFGESIGGGVALQLAERKKVGGVILFDTFTNLPNAIADLVPVTKIVYPQPQCRDALPANEYNNEKALATLRIPVLIIAGKKDGIIPWAHSEQLFKVANEPKKLVLLPNSGHGAVTGDDGKIFLAALKQFYTER